MITIRRTRHRTFPLLLKAEHEDRGPYHLVDKAGYGASWVRPGHENVPIRNEYPARYAGASHVRRTTWIPVFERAKLAFTLVEEDDDIGAKTAKRIADKTYDKLGSRASPADAERYAFYLLRKFHSGEQRRTRRDPSGTEYRGFRIERFEAVSARPSTYAGLGRGESTGGFRKERGYLIHLPDGGTKFVPTLKRAREYIDNY